MSIFNWYILELVFIYEIAFLEKNNLIQTKIRGLLLIDNKNFLTIMPQVYNFQYIKQM